MTGGLIQIVTYGSQDLYLTGTPEITFFKVVYRRHTNFSIETFEHSLLDGPQFGSMSTAEIHRNGDLMTKMYLRVIIQGIIPAEGEKFATGGVGESFTIMEKNDVSLEQVPFIATTKPLYVPLDA